MSRNFPSSYAHISFPMLSCQGISLARMHIFDVPDVVLPKCSQSSFIRCIRHVPGAWLSFFSSFIWHLDVICPVLFDLLIVSYHLTRFFSCEFARKAVTRDFHVCLPWGPMLQVYLFQRLFLHWPPHVSFGLPLFHFPAEVHHYFTCWFTHTCPTMTI